MALEQSLFLRIYDGGTTYHRWQNHYISKIVPWDGQSWVYVGFSADGITAGDISSESSLVISMPQTSITKQAIRNALRDGYLFELSLYEFDSIAGQTAPPINQQLVASYLGEIIAATGTLTFQEVEIGAPLSPVGVQIPPRTYASRLTGTPAQL